jgi:hypothetical protein
VTSEGAGGGEFAQLVSHHLLVDDNRDVLAPVVDGDRVADHLGDDGGSPRPSFDHFLLFVGIELFNFFEQVVGNEWAFF